MNATKLLLAAGLVLFSGALSGCITSSHGYGDRGGYDAYGYGPSSYYATRVPVVVHHRVDVHHVHVKERGHRERPRAQGHPHPRKPERVHQRQNQQHSGKGNARHADERGRDRHAQARRDPQPQVTADRRKRDDPRRGEHARRDPSGDREDQDGSARGDRRR